MRRRSKRDKQTDWVTKMSIPEPVAYSESYYASRTLEHGWIVTTPYGTAQVVHVMPNGVAKLQLEWASQSYLYTREPYPSVVPTIGSCVLVQAGNTASVQGRVWELRPHQAVVRLTSWRLSGCNHVTCIVSYDRLQVIKAGASPTLYEQVLAVQEAKQRAMVYMGLMEYEPALKELETSLNHIALLLQNTRTRSIRANLLLTKIKTCHLASLAAARLRDWQNMIKHSMTALQVIRSLQVQAAFIDTNSEAQLVATVRIFGAWKVKSLRVVALALYQLQQYDPAIALLEQAHKICLSIRQNKECRRLKDWKARKSQLKLADESVLRLYAVVCVRKNQCRVDSEVMCCHESSSDVSLLDELGQAEDNQDEEWPALPIHDDTNNEIHVVMHDKDEGEEKKSDFELESPGECDSLLSNVESEQAVATDAPITAVKLSGAADGVEAIEASVEDLPKTDVVVLDETVEEYTPGVKASFRDPADDPGVGPSTPSRQCNLFQNSNSPRCVSSAPSNASESLLGGVERDEVVAQGVSWTVVSHSAQPGSCHANKGTAETPSADSLVTLMNRPKKQTDCALLLDQSENSDDEQRSVGTLLSDVLHDVLDEVSEGHTLGPQAVPVAIIKSIFDESLNHHEGALETMSLGESHPAIVDTRLQSLTYLDLSCPPLTPSRSKKDFVVSPLVPTNVELRACDEKVFVARDLYIEQVTPKTKAATFLVDSLNDGDLSALALPSLAISSAVEVEGGAKADAEGTISEKRMIEMAVAEAKPQVDPFVDTVVEDRLKVAGAPKSTVVYYFKDGESVPSDAPVILHAENEFALSDDVSNTEEVDRALIEGSFAEEPSVVEGKIADSLARDDVGFLEVVAESPTSPAVSESDSAPSYDSAKSVLFDTASVGCEAHPTTRECSTPVVDTAIESPLPTIPEHPDEASRAEPIEGEEPSSPRAAFPESPPPFSMLSKSSAFRVVPEDTVSVCSVGSDISTAPTTSSLESDSWESGPQTAVLRPVPIKAYVRASPSATSHARASPSPTARSELKAWAPPHLVRKRAESPALSVRSIDSESKMTQPITGLRSDGSYVSLRRNESFYKSSKGHSLRGDDWRDNLKVYVPKVKSDESSQGSQDWQPSSNSSLPDDMQMQSSSRRKRVSFADDVVFEREQSETWYRKPEYLVGVGAVIAGGAVGAMVINRYLSKSK